MFDMTVDEVSEEVGMFRYERVKKNFLTEHISMEWRGWTTVKSTSFMARRKEITQIWQMSISLCFSSSRCSQCIPRKWSGNQWLWKGLFLIVRIRQKCDHLVFFRVTRVPIWLKTSASAVYVHLVLHYLPKYYDGTTLWCTSQTKLFADKWN